MAPPGTLFSAVEPRIIADCQQQGSSAENSRRFLGELRRAISETIEKADPQITCEDVFTYINENGGHELGSNEILRQAIMTYVSPDPVLPAPTPAPTPMPTTAQDPPELCQYVDERRSTRCGDPSIYRPGSGRLCDQHLCGACHGYKESNQLYCGEFSCARTSSACQHVGMGSNGKYEQCSNTSTRRSYCSSHTCPSCKSDKLSASRFCGGDRCIRSLEPGTSCQHIYIEKSLPICCSVPSEPKPNLERRLCESHRCPNCHGFKPETLAFCAGDECCRLIAFGCQHVGIVNGHRREQCGNNVPTGVAALLCPSHTCPSCQGDKRAAAGYCGGQTKCLRSGFGPSSPSAAHAPAGYPIASSPTAAAPSLSCEHVFPDPSGSPVCCRDGVASPVSPLCHAHLCQTCKGFKESDVSFCGGNAKCARSKPGCRHVGRNPHGIFEQCGAEPMPGSQYCPRHLCPTCNGDKRASHHHCGDRCCVRAPAH